MFEKSPHPDFPRPARSATEFYNYLDKNDTTGSDRENTRKVVETILSAVDQEITVIAVGSSVKGGRQPKKEEINFSKPSSSFRPPHDIDLKVLRGQISAADVNTAIFTKLTQLEGVEVNFHKVTDKKGYSKESFDVLFKQGRPIHLICSAPSDMYAHEHLKAETGWFKTYPDSVVVLASNDPKVKKNP